MRSANSKFILLLFIAVSSLLLIPTTVAHASSDLNARTDRASTLENNAVTINVLANDYEVDGTSVNLNISKDPENGIASVNSDNTITYTPDQGFFGNDSFRYRVENADGEEADALVIIKVKNVNEPPIPEDDLILTHEEETVKFNIKAQDVDIDTEKRFKHTVDFSIYSGPQHGKLSGNPDRVGYEAPNTVFVELNYTPEKGFKGKDTLIFSVKDSAGAKNYGTITIDVVPVGEPLTSLSGYFDNKVEFNSEEGLLSSFSSKSSFTYEVEDFEVKTDSTFQMDGWSSLRTKLQFPFGLADVSSTFSFYPEASPPFNFDWNNSTSLSLGEVDFTHIFNFSPTPNATYSQFKSSWSNQGVQHKASMKFDTVEFKFGEFNIQSIYEMEDCSAALSTNLSLSDEGFDDFSVDVKEVPLIFNFYMDISLSFADLNKEVSTSFKYKSEWIDCFKLLVEPVVISSGDNEVGLSGLSIYGLSFRKSFEDGTLITIDASTREEYNAAVTGREKYSNKLSISGPVSTSTPYPGNWEGNFFLGSEETGELFGWGEASLKYKGFLSEFLEYSTELIFSHDDPHLEGKLGFKIAW